MKVLVISDYRNYHTARPEASIFMGLAKEGFEVHIMTYKDSRLTPEFEAVGIKVIDFHPEKKFDKGEIKRIHDYIVEEKIDILHVFNSISSVNGIRAAKNLDVKVVLYRGFTGNIHWYDPTDYLKYLNPRVDKIFCNSIGVEQLLHRQLFFDKTKAITINKGHDIEWYKDYEALDIKKELGLPKDAFLAIMVCNNRRMKGIKYLLGAMNMLPADANVHLLLAGRDLDTQDNLTLVKSGNRTDKVHFLGFRTDVLNVVAACDIFVLSSIFGESITKSVIEAMSLGVAPVITDIPGNVELVVHEESGLVARAKNPKDLSEHILRLYENQEECKSMGLKAKQRIEEHLNHKQTIIKTKKMYEDLCS